MNKRLHDDVVIIVLKRNKSAQHQYYKQQRRGSVIDESTSSNQSFYLELNISSPSSNKRKFNQLKWKHYAVNLVCGWELCDFIFQNEFFVQIIQGKNQVKTNFELTLSKYPPLMFSRVKSYHSTSECPLQ